MLTQLTTLKARLGIAAHDVADDTLLTNFIKHATARFDRECNRTFARGSGITGEFGGDDTELRVSRFPVESVTSFHLKSNETDGWELQSDVEHVIRRACVISLPTALGTWQQQLRVTYTGGYVLPGTTPAAGQTALPDDIEQSCAEQCVYWYQNRDRLGLVSVGGEGASVQQFAQLDLLPHVKAALSKHHRWNA